MAKNSDQLGEADKAGLLTGLFAEENEYDRRALWRIGSWGVAAVGAVALAVTSNQWSLGLRRDQLAAVDLSRQAQQIQSMTREGQSETRRLANAVDTLNSDRDRLFSRITVLEQGLDSVTGTVAKQVSANNVNAVPKPPPSVSPPPATLMPPSAPPADSQSLAAAPAVTPAATTAVQAAPVDKPRADLAKIDTAKADTTKTDTTRTDPAKTDPAKADTNKADTNKADPNKADTTNTDVAKTDPVKADAAMAAPLPQIASNKPPAQPAPAQATSSAQPIGAPKSMMGPPDPAAPKIVEAAKTENSIPSATPAPPPSSAPAAAGEVAATTVAKDEENAPSDAPASADAEAPKIQRTAFAVELGGASSIGGLRALWRGLLKSNNAELAELRPIIVLRENNSGLGMQLRLAAGPLPNAADAARICAALVESRRACDTTVFDGQRLAMGADEAPNGKPATGAKPSSSSYGKRYYPRRTKKEDPPPAKQESSTFSSLLGIGKR